MLKRVSVAVLLAAVVSLAVPAANAEVDSATITNRKEVIHTCLLRIYLAQKKRPQALAEYAIIVGLKPNDPKLLYQYGVYISQGNTPADYNSALVQLKKAANLDPQNADMSGTIGKLYLRLKNPKEALVWFGKACAAGGGPEYKKLYEDTAKFIQASEARALQIKKNEQAKKQQLELKKKQGETPKGGSDDDDDW
jgi:tetratricopeptide (TPR) repeat protein